MCRLCLYVTKNDRNQETKVLLDISNQYCTFILALNIHGSLKQKADIKQQQQQQPTIKKTNTRTANPAYIKKKCFSR